MSDLSTGNDDKSVAKSSSFKFFGLNSPARSPSTKKKANPFSKMFSRSKKIDKQNVPDDDAESDPSITSTEHNAGMIEETVTTSLATMLHNVEEAAPKVIEEVVRHVNPDNLVQQMAKVKESAPAIDEKKPAEFFNKFVEKAKKTKEEVKEKAREQLHKIANEGSQAYKAITTSIEHKASPIEPLQIQPQEKSVNVIDESNAPPVPLSSLAQGVQDEAIDVAAGAATRSKTVETTKQGEEQEEKKEVEVEDNCVTSLAQGLQKICGQWSNNKKED